MGNEDIKEPDYTMRLMAAALHLAKHNLPVNSSIYRLIDTALAKYTELTGVTEEEA